MCVVTSNFLFRGIGVFLRWAALTLFTDDHRTFEPMVGNEGVNINESRGEFSASGQVISRRLYHRYHGDTVSLIIRSGTLYALVPNARHARTTINFPLCMLPSFKMRMV